jgi:hypothetical protein
MTTSRRNVYAYPMRRDGRHMSFAIRLIKPSGLLSAATQTDTQGCEPHLVVL